MKNTIAIDVVRGLICLYAFSFAANVASQEADVPFGCEDQDLSVGGETRLAKLIVESKKHAAYPEAARRAHISGQVTFRLIISPEGIVTDAVVTKSDNPGYGFEEASEEAIRQWRYEPAMCNGRPIQTYHWATSGFDIGGSSLTKKELKRAARRARRSPNVPRNISIGKKNIIYVAGEEDVTNPTPIDTAMVRPIFPERARSHVTEARVVLQVVVRRDGSVTDIETIRSSAKGYGFEEAAIAAVRQWRYRPAIRNGVPVDVSFTIKVTFNLD